MEENVATPKMRFVSDGVELTQSILLMGKFGATSSNLLAADTFLESLSATTTRFRAVLRAERPASTTPIARARAI